MAAAGERRPVTSADVEEVRATLRLSDPGARADAVGRLRRYQGAPLAPGAAARILRAAGLAYPWVAEVPDDVGELLVQLLWAEPAAVGAADLVRNYSFCAERARRAILRTLALREDSEGLDAIEQLMGLDGPRQLLPVPTPDLLDPLLGVDGVERLVPSLVAVAWRRGWIGVVAHLLSQMAKRGLLTRSMSAAVCEGLTPLVTSLVETCDRGDGDSTRTGLARVDRSRLSSLVPLFAELEGDSASEVLRRVLASVDPGVAAAAVVALARRGELVGEDRVAIIARDPQARAVLLDGLTPLGRGFELPESMRSEVAVAEAEVVKWLASRAQLAAAPDDIEHRGTFAAPRAWGPGMVHVFAFRVRPPHWSAERGYMLVAAGPFDPQARLLPRRSEGFAVHSLYASEDGEDLYRHLLAISEAVVQIRGEEAA